MKSGAEGAKKRKTELSHGLEARREPALFGSLLLGAAALLAYLPALRGAGFVWDDPEYVINNPALRSWAGLRDIWVQPGATPQYYPLVFTSFWIEYQLWGLKAQGYHLINVLLHAGSAVLLWRLLGRLAVPGAFAAAAIFLLHPVHVESVAWITERKNVLSLFFYLCAFGIYWRSALEERSRAGPAPFPWTAFLFFCLALLCKTVTCTFPAAVLLVLWWKGKRIRARELMHLGVFAGVGAGLAMVTIWMEREHVGALGDAWSLGLWERFLLAGRIPWFYAWKLVWPLDLVFIYPRWHIDAESALQILPLAGLAVLAAGLFLLRRRLGRGPLTAVLFFVGSLFPALGFFNVYPMRFSYVADHFQYLASLGLIVLAAGAAAHGLRRLGARRKAAGAALLAAVAAVLGTLTFQQAKIYNGQVTLWEDTIAKNPGAWIAYNNLAEIRFDRGEVDQAMALCEAALALKPDLAEAHGNLANALYGKGRYEEAVAHFEKVLDLGTEPRKRAIALSNLGAVYEAMGSLDEAVERFEQAIAQDPAHATARYNLANVLVKQNRLKEAAEQYRLALRAGMDSFQARYRLGVVLQALGMRDEAAVQLRAALGPARMAGKMELAREIEGRIRQCEQGV